MASFENIDSLNGVLSFIRHADSKTRELIQCETIPSGIIVLEIQCAGHGYEELAADKVEEIINRIGLDTAADILSRNV